MSRSAGRPASNAFTLNRATPAFSLSVSLRMLPLVERIVRDITRTAEQLERLRPELDRLNQNRVALPWPARQRRYLIQEEMDRSEQDHECALGELAALDVALLDPAQGQVGFPTIVNRRRAYFSWRPGDDGLHFWHFHGERSRRAIPPRWKEELRLA